jgi:hypothetical protein
MEPIIHKHVIRKRIFTLLSANFDGREACLLRAGLHEALTVYVKY